jgi:predicted GTPase
VARAASAPHESVVSLIHVNTRIVRARYEFAETAEPGLGRLLDAWLAGRPLCAA